MLDSVYVLLSKDGGSLKVFLKSGFQKPVEITDISRLEEFSGHWVVKNYPDIIKQLLLDCQTSDNILSVLQNVEKIMQQAKSNFNKLHKQYPLKQFDDEFIERYNTSKEIKGELERSFSFLHEHNSSYRGHNRATVCIFGISGSSGPYKAHDESLAKMKSFVEDSLLLNNPSYINGFKYGKISWYNPTWLTYLTTKSDEGFERGRRDATSNRVRF